jgi:Transcriptional regulator containing PAS, AAA-type ATPase, and DNA-binding domains
MMSSDDISAESLLNMVMDEIDDLIVINDADKNVIWMNRSALKRLNTTLDAVVGTKCYKLFGATCCCDKCNANNVVGGPRHCGCKFKNVNVNGELECVPIPYYKEGRLKVVVQHIRACNKNE